MSATHVGAVVPEGVDVVAPLPEARLVAPLRRGLVARVEPGPVGAAQVTVVEAAARLVEAVALLVDAVAVLVGHDVGVPQVGQAELLVTLAADGGRTLRPVRGLGGEALGLELTLLRLDPRHLGRALASAALASLSRSRRSCSCAFSRISAALARDASSRRVPERETRKAMMAPMMTTATTIQMMVLVSMVFS